MSLEEKLEATGATFAYFLEIFEQLLKKHNISMTEFYQDVAEALKPQYKKLLNEKGSAEVIKALAYMKSLSLPSNNSHEAKAGGR